MDPDNPGAEDLPVRTRRTRRGGRHRNPDTVLLPPEPPALVLAVPGAPRPDVTELVTALVHETSVLADAAEQGLDVRAGYLDGTRESLACVPTEPRDGPTEPRDGPTPARPDAVIVPLLAAPHPPYEAELRRAAEGAPLAVAAPLGPHPLLAGILHHRLAESGLARPERVRQLNVTTAAGGVIVAVAGGTAAARAAEASAVLLASRLAVPAVPAALDEEGGVEEAAGTLHASGASRLAFAPCLIGPEIAPDRVERAAAGVGAQSCAPVGAHADVAKLVLASYVNALDEALAGGL